MVRQRHSIGRQKVEKCKSRPSRSSFSAVSVLSKEIKEGESSVAVCFEKVLRTLKRNLTKRANSLFSEEVVKVHDEKRRLSSLSSSSNSAFNHEYRKSILRGALTENIRSVFELYLEKKKFNSIELTIAVIDSGEILSGSHQEEKEEKDSLSSSEIVLCSHCDCDERENDLLYLCDSGKCGRAFHGSCLLTFGSAAPSTEDPELWHCPFCVFFLQCFDFTYEVFHNRCIPEEVANQTLSALGDCLSADSLELTLEPLFESTAEKQDKQKVNKKKQKKSNEKNDDIDIPEYVSFFAMGDRLLENGDDEEKDDEEFFPDNEDKCSSASSASSAASSHSGEEEREEEEEEEDYISANGRSNCSVFAVPVQDSSAHVDGDDKDESSSTSDSSFHSSDVDCDSIDDDRTKCSSSNHSSVDSFVVLN